MKSLLRNLAYWISFHKWACPVRGCMFRTYAADGYVIDMVREAHTKYHEK